MARCIYPHYPKPCDIPHLARPGIRVVYNGDVFTITRVAKFPLNCAPPQPFVKIEGKEVPINHEPESQT